MKRAAWAVSLLTVVWLGFPGCARSVPEIMILPEDQVCAADADCIRVDHNCGGCTCGQPVNKAHKQKYWDMLDEQCRDYRGPVCDFACSLTPVCVDQRCALVPR